MAGKENISTNNLYRYMHANMRLRLRYGIEIAIDEYNELCRLMATGCGRGRREEGDMVEAWLEIKPDVWAAAVYRKSESCIVTFMPMPPADIIPHLNSVELDKLVTAKAQKLAEERIKNIQRDMNLIVDGEVPRKYATKDVQWMVSSIKESLDLARYGYLSDALARIEVILSIDLAKRPTSHVATTEEIVTSNSQYLKKSWHDIVLKFFKKNGVP
jgi:hypothetical protein